MLSLLNQEVRSVSIVTPTYKRPDALERCIKSVQSLEIPEGVAVEHLIIDNDPAGGAERVAKNAEQCGLAPLRYVHEPQAGVSHARNRGVSEAHGEWIAWLDDDQTVGATWLKAYISSQNNLGVDLLFGAIEASFEHQPPERLWRAPACALFAPSQPG